MKVIKPIPIGTSELISTTAPEPTPIYDAGKNYAIDELCIAANVIYKSIQTPNVGKAPASNPLHWARVKVGNRYAMFDNSVSTQTTATNALTVVFKVGCVDHVSLFNLVGDSVEISITNGVGGAEVYRSKKSLDGSMVSTFAQYVYAPKLQKKEVVFADLPMYFNSIVTVTITGVDVACGVLVAGLAVDLGSVEYGATIRLLNYSQASTAVSGETTFTAGKSAKLITVDALFKNRFLNAIFQALEERRSTPCAWISVDAEGYEILSAFGFYVDASVSIPYATDSRVSLQIQGLT